MDFSEMIKIAIEAVNEMRKIRDEALQAPVKIRDAIERLNIIYSDCQSKLGVTIQENQIVIRLFQLFVWHYLDILCRLIDKLDTAMMVQFSVYDGERVRGIKNWRRQFPIGSPPDIATVFPTQPPAPQVETPDITAQINIQNILDLFTNHRNDNLKV